MTLNTKKLFLLIGIIPLIVLGCSSKFKREDLPGKYCFNRTDNRDSIFINKDNTYKHKYITNNGKLLEVMGNWEYNSTSCEILFKEFMFFNDEGGTYGSVRGNWFSKVRLVDNEIRLMYSAEDNIYFSKSNSFNETHIDKTNKFSGNGNTIKELNLTGHESLLKLSYEFYKEQDELIVYDQNGKELHRIGMRATQKNETVTINLSGVTKLILEIKSQNPTSKWNFSTEME